MTLTQMFLDESNTSERSAPKKISKELSVDSEIVFAHGDALDILRTCPTGFAQLIITSPPYNIGKEYETATNLEKYLKGLDPILRELVRVLAPEGSLCWQVGNYIENKEVFPLDIYFYSLFKKLGLKLRNRVIWTFDHGLHCSLRFSGRYETLLWFTKGDKYVFDLDAVRVPSKYPGKTHYKPGPKYGLPSGNPLGKNPSDVWKFMVNEWETGLWAIPNVKANHPEKTLHPCQFSIELVERCILALTKPNDWVLDPFSGVGSAMLAAVKLERRAMGCEREINYVEEAKNRMKLLFAGKLPYRPLGKPVHKPTGREKVSQAPALWVKSKEDIS
ncbi:MAG: site-specific DNA-methyltransferase [Deltaproteobacteria bacterium]|jgi:DNA modification methylase|nr:site-specific DNA-methyltransferase [Deltaproteobacteria bacterium]